MKTRPIGEVFEIDGEQYEVVEAEACADGCAFNIITCRAVQEKTGYCFGRRTDGKSVIFVRVAK